MVEVGGNFGKAGAPRGRGKGHPAALASSRDHITNYMYLPYLGGTVHQVSTCAGKYLITSPPVSTHVLQSLLPTSHRHGRLHCHQQSTRA